MDQSVLRAELNDLAGLDLTTDQANALLSQGHRELCERSEWTQRIYDFGPSIAGTSIYALPSNYYRMLFLQVDGAPYESVDRRLLLEMAQGTWAQRDGTYTTTMDAYGTESLLISPVPTADGQLIRGRIVYTPNDLVDGGLQPLVPDSFQRAIIDYVAAVVYGEVEDDSDVADRYLSEFERRLTMLKQLRIARNSRGEEAMLETALAGGP